MLTRLHITNFILIDDLEIDFEKGLCALTGETGAGKSILLNAIALISGKRADSNCMRDKEKNTILTASFNIAENDKIQNILTEHEITHDDELIIRRVITPNGKSKIFVNDLAISLNLLTSLTDHLLEICGQHAQKGLLETSQHIVILDSYGDNALLKKCEAAYITMSELQKKLAIEQEKATNVETEKKYLTEIIADLEKLDLQEENEIDVLIAKKNSLKTRTQTKEILHQIIQRFSDKINSEFIATQKELDRNLENSPEIFQKLIDEIEKSLLSSDEIINLSQNALNEISQENDNLEDIETRISDLKSAARKFNIIPQSLGNFLLENQNKLAELNNLTNNIALLINEIATAKKEYNKIAQTLSEKRKKDAQYIAKEVKKHLVDLDMPKAEFRIQFAAKDPSGNGIDKVSFEAITNPGMGFASLNKIASGGELSRFMLALKLVFAAEKENNCLIFDEIDSGISGSTSAAVGEKLANLSKQQQVILITHQPQIASKSDLHLKIIKSQGDSKTNVTIAKLDKDSKQNEIARMISGKIITNEALKAAKNLMNEKSA